MSIRNLFKYVRTKDENLNKAFLSAKDQFDQLVRGINNVPPNARKILTTSPLAGGGDFSIDRTFSLGGLASIGTADYQVKVNHAGTAWEYQSKAIVDVRDYGAVGDNVTNDKAAIQAAINAAQASGDTLVIPPGDYMLNGTGDQLILIDGGKPFNISGAGSSKSRFTIHGDVGVSTDMFRILPGTGQAMSGMRWEGFSIIPRSGAPGRDAIVFDFTAAAAADIISRLTMEDILAYGGAGVGLKVNNTDTKTESWYNNTVQNCVFHGGAHLHRIGDNNSFYNVNFSNGTPALFLTVVSIDPTPSCHNTIFKNCSISYSVGAITVEDCHYLVFDHFTIESSDPVDGQLIKIVGDHNPARHVLFESCGIGMPDVAGSSAVIYINKAVGVGFRNNNIATTGDGYPISLGNTVGAGYVYLENNILSTLGATKVYEALAGTVGYYRDQFGRVVIGHAPTYPSAALDVTDITGALLLPRMNTTQRDALTAVNGMQIYNSTLNEFQMYENGAWVGVVGAGGGVPTSRLISTTAPLAGGGNLSADRTLSIGYDTNDLEVSGANLRFVNPINVKRYASFAAAITAIGATLADLYIASTCTISADVTVPRNVTLCIATNGRLDIATGVTLTIEGDIRAGVYQIFTMNGTAKVKFGYQNPDALTRVRVRCVYPQWFGAVAYGTTDDRKAIQDAIDSVSMDTYHCFYGGGGIVYFVPGIYIIGAALTVKHGVTLAGIGMHSTGATIKLLSSTTVAKMIQPPTGQEINMWGMRDLVLDGNCGGGSKVTGGVLYSDSTHNSAYFENLMIWNVNGDGTGYCILIDSGDANVGGGTLSFNKIQMCPGSGVPTDPSAGGIYIHNTVTDRYPTNVNFRDVQIEQCHGYPNILVSGLVDYSVVGLQMENIRCIGSGVIPIQLNSLRGGFFRNITIYTDQTTGISLNGTSTKKCSGNTFINIDDNGQTTPPFTNIIIDYNDTAYISGPRVDFYVQGNDSYKRVYFGNFSLATKTPASAGAAGKAGEFCWDSGYLYVCVAANTWKRGAIATW